MDVYAVLDWTTTCWFMVFGTNPLNAFFGVGWVKIYCYTHFCTHKFQIMSPTIDDVGFLPTNIMTLALAINRFVAISGFSIGISEKLFANVRILFEKSNFKKKLFRFLQYYRTF